MAAAAPASRGVRCLTLPLRCRCGGQWVAVRRGHRWWGHDHVWWVVSTPAVSDPGYW